MIERKTLNQLLSRLMRIAIVIVKKMFHLIHVMNPLFEKGPSEFSVGRGMKF